MPSFNLPVQLEGEHLHSENSPPSHECSQTEWDCDKLPPWAFSDMERDCDIAVVHPATHVEDDDENQSRPSFGTKRVSHVSGGELECGEHMWRLHTQDSSIDWVSPPDVLHRLISELFASTPQDVLSWVHMAAWRLREETLAGQGPEWNDGFTRRVSPSYDIVMTERTTDRTTEASNNLRPSKNRQSALSNKTRLSLEAEHIDPSHTTAYYNNRLSQYTFNGSGTISDNALAVDGLHPRATTPRKRRISRETGSRPLDIPWAETSMNASALHTADDPAILDFTTNRSKALISTVNKCSRQSGSGRDISSSRAILSRGASQVSKEGAARVSRMSELPLAARGSNGTSDSMNSGLTEGDTHEYIDYFKNVLGNHSDRSLSWDKDDLPRVGSKPPDWFAPTSRIRFIRGAGFSMCLLFELWALPFIVFFWPDRRALPSWVDDADLFMLVTFGVDILLSLCSVSLPMCSITIEAWQHMSWAPIVKGLRRWIWIAVDIVATIPYVLLLTSKDSSNKNKFYRCLALVRVLRLKRAHTWISHLPLFFQDVRPLLPLVKLQIFVLLVAHSFSILLAVLHPPTHVGRYPGGAYDSYLRALLKSVAALTLGNQPASEWAEDLMYWDMLTSIARFLLLLIVLDWAKERSVAQYSTKDIKVDTGEGKEREVATLNKVQLFAYLRKRGVRPSLQFQIIQSLKAAADARGDESTIRQMVESVSPGLRAELNRSLWAKKIRTLGIMVPLDQWHATFTSELANFARENVHPPGHVLYSNGDPTEAAYLILHGALAVIIAPSTAPLVDYTKGMWVGEQALVNSELSHIETLHCRDRTELMSIRASDFHGLLRTHKLTEEYESFLQETLWMGLCGRCGLFGDHFSKDCWLLPDPDRTCFDWRRVLGGERRPRKTSTKMDLSKLLQELGLTKLQTELRRYSIKNMNDLQTSAFEDFLDDEDSTVPRVDKEKLRKAVEKLKKKAVEGATALMNTTATTDHFIFISHYKMEAGTEATLMQRDLEGHIERNGYIPISLDSPVFVDSENLTNLADLQDCVLRSYNVVILLTPGVLQRPWVLVEIALAFRHEIKVIPVEVQRPNLKFKYPADVESYCKGIGSGDQLESDCKELLDREGIQLSDLESALRELFKIIALPYSPHKSSSIRDAELKDVLKRCNTRKSPALNVKGRALDKSVIANSPKSRATSPGRNSAAQSISQSTDDDGPSSPLTQGLSNSPESLSRTTQPMAKLLSNVCSIEHQQSNREITRLDTVTTAKTSTTSRITATSKQLSVAASQAMSRVHKQQMLTKATVFKEGDRVRVTKESRTKGMTAVVTEPDWHNLVKVYMDVEDEKGRIKTFKHTELVLIDETQPEIGDGIIRFQIGDHVRIIKESRTKGKTATISEPNWHENLVKVVMDEPDEKGPIKSFKCTDLVLIAHASENTGETSWCRVEGMDVGVETAL